MFQIENSMKYAVKYNNEKSILKICDTIALLLNNVYIYTQIKSCFYEFNY